MDILIRRRDEGASGGDAAGVERAHEGATLAVGSALDQDLRLVDEAVAERHATISLAGGAVQLACRRDCSVVVGGETVRKATLADGDVVLLGGHRITVVPAPTGFDLALEVSREKAKGAAPASFRRTRLADTWLAPRAIAWTLSIAVLLAGLAAPLAHHFLETDETVTAVAMDADEAERTAAGAAVADAALNPPDEAGGWLSLLGDGIWSSGPLHDSHAALEDDCGACHEKLFQRVTNASCEACHADTEDHVETASVEINAHLSLTMNGRCASCHEEHNEPSVLVDTRSSVCTDCHANDALADAHGEAMAPVTAFGTGTHPGFDVTLPRPPAAPGEDWTLETLPLADATESSGLVFNHAYHADGERIGRAAGEGLACADCHVASSDGEHYEPVAFEANCASSGCHQLELDEDHRIPHGQPDIAVAAIEGFYLRKFGDPDVDLAALDPDRRRRPGRGAPKVDRLDCGGTNFECALELAERKVEQQFTRTGCVTCHLVESSGEYVAGADNGGTLPFIVAPVRLADDFHPEARFDHDSHGVLVEPGDSRAVTGDAACIHCHEADVSTSAEDLMMPAIDNCTACHDGLTRTANVPLECVDCHEYHPASSSFRSGKDS